MYHRDDHAAVHPDLRPDGVPHGARGARTHYQRAGDWQVQGRIQPVLARLLAQLFLRPVWPSVS